MPNLFDIYFLKVKFRKCFDARPCIVIDIGHGRVAALALISSATGMRREGYDFPILVDHADFPTTGLDRDSHVVCDEIIEIDQMKLTEYVGRFENRLAKEFRDWMGI